MAASPSTAALEALLRQAKLKQVWAQQQCLQAQDQLTQDRAVTPALQQRMVAQSPCVSVQRIEASHSAYFSQPTALAAAIGRVAADTARTGRA